MNRLVIIGAGGHGKVCGEIAELSGKYDEILYLDDDETLTKCLNFYVVGTTKDYQKYLNEIFFVAIGNNSSRKKWCELLTGRLETLVHPKAVVSKYSHLGEGSIVMANAVVNPNTTIGKGNIINTSASIDHDCLLADYVHISPNATICGSCIIGVATWIGAGATVINNLSITNNCIVGAGSVITKSIEDSGKYVGVPIREV